MTRFYIILCVSLCLLTGTAAAGQGFSACELKCEYMESPLAINTLSPKFSWKVSADERGFVQKSYELVVGRSENEVRKGKGDVWRSGKVNDGNSLHVPYGGMALTPGAKYYWSVRIHDSHGKHSQWSEPAAFSVGLFDEADWDGARWIAMEVMPEKERIVPGIENNSRIGENRGERNPGINKLPQFRREIEIRKPVERAVAYVSGLGQFEFYLDGNKVGDHFMDPAWSDYDKQVCYVPFDVTGMLKQGKSALGVMLGNGFISIPAERYYKGLISYMYPKMIFKLAVEYTDGTTDTFVSDRSWRVTESPVTFSSIYGGEDYDATRYREGWMQAGFDDSGWQDVEITALGEGAVLVAQTAYPIRIMQRFPAVSYRKMSNGQWLYDLGQNFQGVVRLTVKGERGQTVSAVPGEVYDNEADTLIVPGGYRGEHILRYTIGRTNRSESWNPQFTYYGQRYVKIRGAVPRGEDNPAGLPVVEDVVGLHIRNSAPVAGGFRCSDELLNKTNKLIEWGIKGNMASYMTDCPHREKLPWIEQLHLMFGSLQYNFDMYKLYEKMSADMATAQWDNGLIPDITPMYMLFSKGFVDSPEWGSSMILVPWMVYEYYGDASLIERYYDSMKRYLEYLASKSEDYILSHGLGDWCDIGPGKPGISQHTSLEATATPIFYMDAVTMKNAAELLGKKTDAAEFEALAEAVKMSYNEKFFHADGCYYDRNSQCANAIAVYAGLVPEKYTQGVIENIVKDVRERGNALTAGDVGYNYVLRTLESAGYSDVIYDMNSRYDVPGYGYQLAHGATSLPETWDARVSHSHNHFMLGHLQEWLYTHVGGIQRDGNSRAYKSFTVKPAVVGGITFAQTDFESPYGTISTDWEVVPGGFDMKVEVPANTTAQIWVPAAPSDRVLESNVPAEKSKGVRYLFDMDGYKIYETGSGIYRFSARSN